MGDTVSGLLTVAALLGLLAAAYVPLGDYLAAVLTPARHNRVERVVYRTLGVNPDGTQSARSYLLAVLAFSAVSILVLFAILLGQGWLPFSRGLPGMPWEMATEHRDLLRHQHQLAVLRRRVDPGLHRPDGRPGRAELRVRRRRDRSGRRPGPRLPGPPGRRGRQLLGRPGPDQPAAAAADRPDRRRCCCWPAGWCRTSLPT